MKVAARSVPIRGWLPAEQPREALFAKGAESLSLSALIAIVIRSGYRGVNAQELSERLLSRFAGLRGIDSAGMEDLCRVAGIGKAKAAQIKAALEIGKRLLREDKSPRISNASSALAYVADYFGPYLRDKALESLCAIMINRRGRPLRVVELGRGSETAVEADVTRILGEALRAGASSLVLVHNHPSGEGRPSEKDVRLTHKIRDACGLFGITLLDHVIVGKDAEHCSSLSHEGLI